MKKIIAVLILSLAYSFAVSARPVSLFPTCYNTPNIAECRVVNTSGDLVTCNLVARAQTKRGGTLQSYQSATLYSGMSAYVRVVAPDAVKDPIVFVSADANCRTVNN